MKKQLALVFFGLLSHSLSFATITDYAVVGDGGKWNAAIQAVRDSIVRSGIKTLIMPGDNLYGILPSYDAVWSNWKQKGFSFPIVAIGNHNGGYAEEVQYFGVPGEFYSQAYLSAYRFIVLNSDSTSSVTRQMNWLESQLYYAQEPLVFLVYHHPTFTSGNHSWREKESFQTALRPLLAKYRSKITGLLLGHDHIASLMSYGGLPAVISGASHSMRERVVRDEMDGSVRVKTLWSYPADATYWTKLHLMPEQSMAQIDFVRSSDDQILCTAFLETGKEPRVAPNCSVPIGTRH